MKDKKHSRREIAFCRLGQSPGVGLWGARVPRGPTFIFFKHGNVAYQIDGNDD